VFIFLAFRYLKDLKDVVLNVNSLLTSVHHCHLIISVLLCLEQPVRVKENVFMLTIEIGKFYDFENVTSC